MSYASACEGVGDLFAQANKMSCRVRACEGTKYSLERILCVSHRVRACDGGEKLHMQLCRMSCRARAREDDILPTLAERFVTRHARAREVTP